MIPIPSGVMIWIASGHVDMRKGMAGLSLIIQEHFKRDPFAGDVYVFRGRGGSLIKAARRLRQLGRRQRTFRGPVESRTCR